MRTVVLQIRKYSLRAHIKWFEQNHWVHRNTVACSNDLKNEDSLFQVETAFFQGLSLLKCPLKHILNSEEKICSRNFTELLRLSYTDTCTEEERERKDNCFRQKNKHFFPLVSCLWICTALEKCINHFYTWNCLRKLEILVQRNQFVERMPMWVLYIYKRNLQRSPVLQLLMYISSSGLTTSPGLSYT